MLAKNALHRLCSSDSLKRVDEKARSLRCRTRWRASDALVGWNVSSARCIAQFIERIGPVDQKQAGRDRPVSPTDDDQSCRHARTGEQEVSAEVLNGGYEQRGTMAVS